jgi:RHS repeat-associated protein
LSKLARDKIHLQSSAFILPMQSPLFGRQFHSSPKYGKDYQGQFKDEETGWNAFDLRMYDARIGRWSTIDPYGQHHSPYLAMSNNNVSYIDPDGGQDVTYYIDGMEVSGSFANRVMRSGHEFDVEGVGMRGAGNFDIDRMRYRDGGFEMYSHTEKDTYGWQDVKFNKYSKTTYTDIYRGVTDQNFNGHMTHGGGNGNEDDDKKNSGSRKYPK